MPLSAGATEALEALGLSPSLPEPRFFEELFLRFSARVPYETLTRSEELSPGGERDPERFLAAFAEEGAPSSGGERALSLLALARGLGFSARLVVGEATRPLGDGRRRPHLALLVTLAGRDVLADPVFPFPVLLPLEGGRDLPSPYGRLSAAVGGGTVRVFVEGQGTITERVRLDLARSPDGTEIPGPFEKPFALRLRDDRALLYTEGRVEVLDPWSRLTYPLAPGGRRALEALFTIELGDAALSEVATEGPPTLTVYDRSGLAAPSLLARLSSPDGQLALRTPGTRIQEITRDEGSWTWTLTDEGGGRLTERVDLLPQGARVLRVEGESPITSRTYTLEEEPEGTRVTLAAILANAVPPAGLTEAVRKTLVFHLVSELLALGRE